MILMYRLGMHAISQPKSKYTDQRLVYILTLVDSNNGRIKVQGENFKVRRTFLLLLKDVLVSLVERNARHVVADGKADHEKAAPAAQYSCRI